MGALGRAWRREGGLNQRPGVLGLKSLLRDHSGTLGHRLGVPLQPISCQGPWGGSKDSGYLWEEVQFLGPPGAPQPQKLTVLGAALGTAAGHTGDSSLRRRLGWCPLGLTDCLGVGAHVLLLGIRGAQGGGTWRREVSCEEGAADPGGGEAGWMQTWSPCLHLPRSSGDSEGKGFRGGPTCQGLC